MTEQNDGAAPRPALTDYPHFNATIPFAAFRGGVGCDGIFLTKARDSTRRNPPSFQSSRHSIGSLFRQNNIGCRVTDVVSKANKDKLAWIG